MAARPRKRRRTLPSTNSGVKSRVRSIIRRLKQAHPEARVALRYSSPLELLIATILSAQCTDERVNMVTPLLFEKYRTAQDYASADPRELEEEIRSTGFFRAKTRSIIGCCTALVDRFDGTVPKSMEELVTLQGVGRKTANVVLGNFFGITEGIVVDTHVTRLAERLGFSGNKDAEKIERDLMEIVPRADWITIGNLLIWHGRKVCQARKPKCLECTVGDLCPSFKIFVKKR